MEVEGGGEVQDGLIDLGEFGEVGGVLFEEDAFGVEFDGLAVLLFLGELAGEGYFGLGAGGGDFQMG